MIGTKEPRVWVSPRTDLVTALLGVWFGVGLMIDAWAHANLAELETFFTPWHAVFYSGFVAVSGWIIWQVWRNVRDGRHGLAAVPMGYLAGLVALRSAWSAPGVTARPRLGRLLPALIGLAFATALVSLFLSYGDALQYRPQAIVQALSMGQQDSGVAPRGAGPRPVALGADRVAVAMVVTNVVVLSPVLFLLRRWPLPFGSVTIMYTVIALMPGVRTSFGNPPILLSFLAAGLVGDLLIHWLRPSAGRRAAYWAFAGLSTFVTWSLYIAAASATGGGLPAVPELWTGAPIVAGLIGLTLGALFLPNADPY